MTWPRMLYGKKIVVVMPAYNAALTLERTLREVDAQVVDEIVVVDDASHDDTAAVAQRLGLRTLVHPQQPGLRRQPEDLLHRGPARWAPTWW